MEKTKCKQVIAESSAKFNGRGAIRGIGKRLHRRVVRVA